MSESIVLHGGWVDHTIDKNEKGTWKFCGDFCGFKCQSITLQIQFWGLYQLNFLCICTLKMYCISYQN